MTVDDLSLFYVMKWHFCFIIDTGRLNDYMNVLGKVYFYIKLSSKITQIIMEKTVRC